MSPARSVPENNGDEENRHSAPVRPKHLVSGPALQQCNALTIDVEDYFHVEAFAGVIDRRDWDSQPRRVTRNTNRLLDILAEAGVIATFFTLGWVAARHPELVQRIA